MCVRVRVYAQDNSWSLRFGLVTVLLRRIMYTERQLQMSIVSLAMQEDRLVDSKRRRKIKLFIYNTVSLEQAGNSNNNREKNRIRQNGRTIQWDLPSIWCNCVYNFFVIALFCRISFLAFATNMQCMPHTHTTHMRIYEKKVSKSGRLNRERCREREREWEM